MQVEQCTAVDRLVPIIVLHAGDAQGFSISAIDLPAPREGVDRFAFLRRAAHSPAFGHLWPVSDLWSRQKVPRHDSQRKGRKSSWLQYAYWQCSPINVGSFSSIFVKVDSSGGSERDDEAILNKWPNGLDICRVDVSRQMAKS